MQGHLGLNQVPKYYTHSKVTNSFINIVLTHEFLRILKQMFFSKMLLQNYINKVEIHILIKFHNSKFWNGKGIGIIFSFKEKCDWLGNQADILVLWYHCGILMMFTSPDSSKSKTLETSSNKLYQKTK